MTGRESGYFWAAAQAQPGTTLPKMVPSAELVWGEHAEESKGWGWSLVFTNQLHALGQMGLFQLSTSSSTGAGQAAKPDTFVSLHTSSVSFNPCLNQTNKNTHCLRSYGSVEKRTWARHQVSGGSGDRGLPTRSYVHHPRCLCIHSLPGSQASLCTLPPCQGTLETVS